MYNSENLRKFLGKIILFAFIQFTVFAMNREDIFTFFDISDKDAMKIKWAHAANSVDSLNEALNDSHTLMIESDVIWNHISGLSIMAHPPITESDLSFEQWLLKISQWNETKKGAKADFKSIESAEFALPIIERYKNDIRFPLWLNADVCLGVPGSAVPLNGQKFLHFCNLHSPRSLLSLGWTTPAYLTEDMKHQGGYGSNEINSMLYLLKNISEIASITFPVRAALITGNSSHLINLVSKNNLYSLTVWTSKADTLMQKDFAALVEIRRKIGQDRVFYDLPDSDLAQLKSLIH